MTRIPAPVGICPTCANETRWGNCESCAKAWAEWQDRNGCPWTCPDSRICPCSPVMVTEGDE